ncbi:MAG: 16S rRNA (guanine(966)-N(2))-methyltransferase RsmD, partial [Moraxellaceae bacterium]|nr:16S rRNA (guanine(966)-N(2))-methyltransferase RsmD [Pseudobdellovibrionaceae bacterium]
TRIVIESIKQERIDDTYGDLVCYDRLDYGDKFLSFFAQPE